MAPSTLAADAQRVYFHDGEKVVCLNRTTGKQAWASEPLPIKVNVRGTNDLDKVHIIRGDQILYSHAGNGPEATFEYTDESARGERGTHYYYVRVEQKDGQVAWASPIWVTY